MHHILSFSLFRSSLSCTVTLLLYLSPRERERERFTSARAWPRALFLGCLVLTLFCNSVAPHGVTCTSASPALSSHLASAHTRQQFHLLFACAYWLLGRSEPASIFQKKWAFSFRLYNRQAMHIVQIDLSCLSLQNLIIVAWHWLPIFLLP